MTQEYIHQLQIAGPETSQTFTIPQGSTTIGRQAGNGLVLDHFLVSRRHAQLDCSGVECTLTDMKSANGVLVEGQRIPPETPFPLMAGTVFQIGPFNITYALVVTETALSVEPEPQSEPVAELPVQITEEPVPERREPLVTETAEPLPDIPSLPPVPPVVMAPPPPPPATNGSEPSGEFSIPPGLSRFYSRYLEYLPGIYHTDFMARFLAMFESIMAPVEWNVDNFDLFLDPDTAPAGFIPWLANWFELLFDDSWSDSQRRAILVESHQIFARRGTRWALSRVLEIYIGVAPQIDDQDKNLAPFTFAVTIPRPERGLNRALIEGIIDAHKPAHTMYTLTFNR